MKKIFIITALSGLAFVSCKKDRTCTCTHTEVSGTSTAPGYVFTAEPPTTSTTTYKDIKKNNYYAQSCAHSETTDINRWTSGNNTYETTTVNHHDCELTK